MMEFELPALILTSCDQEARAFATILAEAQIESCICLSLPELVDRLDSASCALVTEDTLLKSDQNTLARWIAGQPTWSDFPFILLMSRGAPPDAGLIETLGNVSLVERPFLPCTMVAAVRLACRTRQRQYKANSYLEELERLAEGQTLLIGELQHRVKNTLATVQALLGPSARSSTSVDSFYNSLSERILSLAKTHNLLTENSLQRASLRQLLENELDPYNDAEGGRILLNGPTMEFAEGRAVSIGMGIHELTTNAAKHGALSTDKGRIEVAWDVCCDSGRRLLRLHWKEFGGPPVRLPTRKGFGSALLHRVLEVQCKAKTVFDYCPAGLHFQMEVPI
jgi:two-component sensor histidine kinase